MLRFRNARKGLPMTRRKLPVGIQDFRAIRERGYAEKYRDRGEPIHLVGIAFGREERNLLGVRAEPA